MGFLKIAIVLLILTLPVLIFLSVMKYASLDDNFYREKFLEYNVNQGVKQANSLHQKILDFVSGKSESVPSELNEREKQHLWDVRKVMNITTIVLYSFIALFALLLISSAFILRVNNYIINFIGKVMIFGGLLTIFIAAVLLFLITSDFSSTFESFHQLLFNRGSYIFDPATDVIVRLYPEQLFQDLGSRISKGMIISSVIFIALGCFLLFKSKPKKKS